MRKLLATLALSALLGAAAAAGQAATADAAGLAPAVADCNQHGRLTHHYSLVALRGALATMPAEIAEYTDCHDVIERQLLAQLGQLHSNGGGAGQGGGSLVPVWLIVILALLAVAGASLGVVSFRQRRKNPPLH